MSLKDMVDSGKKVTFDFYRGGILYYRTYDGMLFEVPIADTGDGCFLREDKAISFMRWIRKQMEANERGKNES